MAFPILQFGTSRFLQAHADLFVSQALAAGEALGRIAVVQTTGSAESLKRLAVFARGEPYEVRIRGLSDGAVVDRRVTVDSIGAGFDATRDWAAVQARFDEAACILSNTGDRGFELDPADRADTPVPRAFPAKLAKLLLGRRQAGAAPVSLFPCELVPGNGAVLRAAVLQVLDGWGTPAAEREWVGEGCLWINSLVDRIVSEPLEPAGAVAEPYALWAIERRAGAAVPCRHAAVVVTDDLARYERLKLFILNLGHTWLAQGWLARGGPADATVRALMDDSAARADLDDLYDHEVLPVFAAIGLGDEANAYRAQVMERFANPFLDHRLGDIAINHRAKMQRRFGGLIDLAQAATTNLSLPRLRASLGVAEGARITVAG